MLCLKKVYRDELLQLAILLSLLRVDRRSYISYDYDVPAIGVSVDDIQGWNHSHTLVRRDIQIHPKNMDSMLANYEQQVFDDLNFLGRYNRINSMQDVTAYLLNVDGNAENASDVTEASGGAELFNQMEEAEKVDEGELASGIDLSAPNIKSEFSSDLDDYQLYGAFVEPEEILSFKEEDDFSSTSFLGSLEDQPNADAQDVLTEEDLEMIDVLWKQDVDMGFTMDPMLQHEKNDHKKCTKPGPAPEPDPKPNTSLKDILEEDEKLPELEVWEGLPYTIDGETGEYVLKEDISVTSLSVDEPPSALLLQQPDVSLEQAFELVCLDESELPTTSGTAEPINEENKQVDDEDGVEADLDLFDDMIQTPPYHARTFQGRMYNRSTSMEQRWQDLANLLSLPEPNHTHPHPYHHFHHPAATYPGQPDRSVLLHNASLPPPMNDISHSTPYQAMSGASNLGSAVATSMNLTNSSEPIGSDHQNVNFKIENPHDYYYQNGSTEMNHTAATDGFLSSILNDEDLQLVDMAMHEGMYTMRMLEGATSGAPERGASGGTDSDSAVSSMGSERVPSLSSDTEWMETNSDSGHTPADHYSTDYHGKVRWYDYSYLGHSRMGGEANGHRVPQPSVAQKKHHMYGKRYYQDQGAVGGSISNNSMLAASPSAPPSVKFDFSGAEGGVSFPTLHPEVAKSAPETKYSCSVEFSRHLHSAGARPMEPVMHNHTYHLPPDQTQALHRPVARDKQKGRRNDEEPLTRDEKKARAMSVPIAVSEIINLPMDEFNERLSKFDLSESQLSLIRDIRRRGKNKVAAQNCRKRKLDQIMSLADEVKQMRDRKHRLVRERDFLVTETQRMKTKYTQLYRHIFQALRDSEGNPYSPYEWSLQQSADGSVLLVPRSNTTAPSVSLADPDTPPKHKEPDPRTHSRKP